MEALREAGHEVIGTDLYREGFSPAMTEQERRTYMGNDYQSSGVGRYIDTLRNVRRYGFLLSALVAIHAGRTQGLLRPRLGARNRICL